MKTKLFALAFLTFCSLKASSSHKKDNKETSKPQTEKMSVLSKKEKGPAEWALTFASLCWCSAATMLYENLKNNQQTSIKINFNGEKKSSGNPPLVLQTVKREHVPDLLFKIIDTIDFWPALSLFLSSYHSIYEGDNYKLIYDTYLKLFEIPDTIRFYLGETGKNETVSLIIQEFLTVSKKAVWEETTPKKDYLTGDQFCSGCRNFLKALVFPLIPESLIKLKIKKMLTRDVNEQKIKFGLAHDLSSVAQEIYDTMRDPAFILAVLHGAIKLAEGKTVASTELLKEYHLFTKEKQHISFRTKLQHDLSRLRHICLKEFKDNKKVHAYVKNRLN